MAQPRDRNGLFAPVSQTTGNSDGARAKVLSEDAEDASQQAAIKPTEENFTDAIEAHKKAGNAHAANGNQAAAHTHRKRAADLQAKMYTATVTTQR